MNGVRVPEHGTPSPGHKISFKASIYITFTSILAKLEISRRVADCSKETTRWRDIYISIAWKAFEILRASILARCVWKTRNLVFI